MQVYYHRICMEVSHHFDYQCHKDSIKSHNPIVTIAVSHYLKRQQLDTDLYSIHINDRNRRFVLNFLNKMKIRQLQITTNKHLKLFQQYINPQINNIPMIIAIDNNKSVRYMVIFFDFEDSILHKIIHFQVREYSLGDFDAEKSYIVDKVVVKPQGVYTQIVKEENSFYLFGNDVLLDTYQDKYQSVRQQIRIKRFEKGNPTINNYLWAYMRDFSQKYCETKLAIKDNYIYIFFRERSASIFQNIPELQQIPQPLIKKYLEKDKPLKEFISKSPEVFFIKEVGLVGLKSVISKIKKLIEDSIHQPPKQISNPIMCRIINVGNLRIDDSNYKELLQKVQSFKSLEKEHYYIQLKEYAKITNRVKQLRKIFIIYNNFYELIQLQSIIDINWSINKLSEIIEKLQQDFITVKHKIVIENDIEILLLRRNQTSDWKEFIQIINQYSDIMKTIVLKKEYFHQFLNQAKDMKSIITVAMEGFIGTLPNIDRDIVQKVQKCEVVNKNRPTTETESLINQLLKLNLQTYKYKDHLLDVITCYNIEKMNIECIKSHEIVISTKPQKQYVYLTFFEKLMLIERDENGKFIQLKAVEIKKELAKLEQSILNNKIKEAFIYGFHFFYFCKVIEKTEYITNINQVTKVTKNQHLTLLYWKYHVSEKNNYKVQISTKTDETFINTSFCRCYKMMVLDPLLIKEVEIIKLGYGSLKKQHELEGVSFTADTSVFQRIIEVLLEKYSK